MPISNDFSSASIADATIASSGDGYTVTIAGQTVTLENVGTLHFADGDVVVVGAGSEYGTIQAGVDAAGGDVRQVFILNGEYDGQVSVTGKSDLTIVGESEAGVVVRATAGIILQNTVDATTGRAQHAIIAVSDSTDVTIRNLTVDGEDRGNSIAVPGGDFVGIAYANTSGGVDDVTITGIRDALVGDEVSGNQRGNALVVSNTGSAKTFSLTDSTITEFQKTGAIFRNMDVTVDHNEIDGDGPHATIGQNAIQLSSGSFGDVTNNTISGIGYTGSADIVVGGVLVFGSHGGLNIDDNTFNGTHEDDAGIYISNSSDVEASGNILTGADYGVIDIGSTVNDVTDNNYNNVETNYGFYPNTASGPFTVSGTEGSDDLFGTDQGDTFIGLGGNDTIDGGAGIDTVQGYDASYHVARSEGGEWVVRNSTETDSLTNVEKAVVNGQTIWLVDTADELTYALANAVDGDTVQLAPGDYVGTFTVNSKQLTILGANTGKDGDDGSRTDESIIKGHLVLNGTKAVNVDGVEFFADGTTGTTGHGNAAVQLHGSGTYTIQNSRFFSDFAGGNVEATGIMIDTTVSGHVVIDDNYFTGSKHNGFSGASWQRGIWSDGSSPDLDITGNAFEWVRSGLNLDGYDDTRVEMSGNRFLTDGSSATVGTGVSIGIPATGTTYENIHHNDFSGAGTDLNLRNVTGDVTVDFSGTSNTSTTTVEILGGTGNDDLTGSNGVDILFGQSGNDVIHGGAGNDTIYGDADNDTIYGDTDNDTIYGGDGIDTIEGGAGNDTIDGGAGIDTVQGYDASYHVARSEGGEWVVRNNTETDSLTNVEKAVVNGQTIWLVDTADELTYALANAVDGDTVQLAPGDYVGTFTVNSKQLTILGANTGKDGDDGSRTDESIIKGHLVLNGTKAVNVDGVEFFADGTTGTTGHGNAAVQLHGSGTYTIQNSRFFSDFAGGNVEATGIMIDTTVSGHVVIDDNYFTGSKHNGFSGASWQRGIWSDGSSPDLDITGNAFEWVRSGLNLDGYDDTRVEMSGNRFLTDGSSATVGTGVSIGIPATGTTYENIHHNDFSGAGTDLNLRNVTGDVTVDFSGTSNTSTTTVEILGGTGNDDLTGSNGVDILFGQSGNDVIHGGAGNDTIYGDADNDTIYGDTDSDTIYGGDGIDTIEGGAGNDTIDGGAGIDTVQGYDASYHVARSEGGEWVVRNNTETDSLTNVEKAVVNGQTIWLVDTADELTYALANAADGDTVQLAEGTYEGTFTSNGNAVTILGANHGTDGHANRGAESIIKGHLVLTGSGDVRVDGVEFFADNTTGTTGHGNAAIQLHGSGDYTIENSRFFNAIAGGNSEATAIMLDTSVSGHVTIDDNLFTGNSHSGFGGANWQRGIWSDGTSSELHITGNHFHGVRSGMNLDGYDDAKVDISDNAFETNGGMETVGTAISIGTTTGSSYTGVHDNDFSGAGTDLNLRNLTGDVTVDFSGTDNTSTTNVEILGGTGDDDLTGSEGIDIIAGDGLKPGETGGAAGTYGAPGLGNDVIHALGGNDLVYGQSGNDVIHGGAGNDTIYGDADNDTIYGDADNDTIYGGDGIDTIEGGLGSDTIDGGAGIDTAVFVEDFSSLSIIKVGSTYYVSNGTDLDTITGVENFSFNGHTVNLDLNPDALDQTRGPKIDSIVESGTDEDSTPSTLQVNETASAGTNVATVAASDPNLVAGDALTFTLVDVDGNPYTGPFSITKTGDGTAVVKVNGSLDYEAATNHSFSVKVTDGHGHSVTKPVSVDVLDVDDAPLASPVALTASNEDTQRTITAAELLAGVTDVDTPAGGRSITSVTIATGGGSIVNNNNGTWTYTPAANNDTQATFNYTVSDGTSSSSSTATLDLVSVNDAPVASPVTLAASNEDAQRTITVAELLAGVTDVDTSTASLFTSLSIQSGSGSLVDNHNGTWTYTPAANDDTGVTFSYTVFDGNTAVSSTASLNLVPVNDAPVASPVTLIASTEDAQRIITAAQLLAGVTDVDTPAGGRSITSVTIATGGGSIVNNNNGTWTYTPAANNDTQATFNYTVSDGTSSSSSTATLDLVPVNDAPVASPVTLAASNEDAQRTITVAELLAGVTDVDTSTASLFTSLSIQSGSGSLVDNHNGTWTYTPAANDDTGVTFSYTVFDGNTAVSSTASLNLVPVDDPAGSPTPAGLTLEAGLRQADLGLIAGTDPDGPQTFKVVALPPQGILFLNGVALAVGQELTEAEYEALTYSSPEIANAAIPVQFNVSAGTTTSLLVFNILVTAAQSTTYTGTGGVDRLDGGAGKDTIDGGLGADTMIGGTGNDTYKVDNTGDVVDEVGGNGIDMVQSSINFSLLNSVHVLGQIEQLTLTGGAAINGIGNALDNLIVGNGGANVLNGLGGSDTMIGGHGNDTYVVDNGRDTVDERGGNGIDLVLSSATFNFASRAFGSVENLTLYGSGAIDGTGNALNNVITGNAAANTLNGGAGNDTLVGGLGNDTLVGGVGADRFHGGAGIDTLTGGAGNDYFVFNTALNASTNWDKVTDFNAAQDTMGLENAIFSRLGTGTLQAANFHVGGSAADANDYIVYDKTTGALSYDSDGSGAGSAIHFATLTTKPTLTNADFIII